MIKYYNENKDLYYLKLINKNNEPIEYNTINDLMEKYRKNNVIKKRI